MDRVPFPVFEFLGCTREQAQELGMVGCGLQLADSGEYSWRDTTCTLDLGKDSVKIFLFIEGIPFDKMPEKQAYARVRLLHMEEYVKYYSSIEEFLQLYRRNRFLRLGSRARLDPWELDSHDSFILRMDDQTFNECFISDPRGRISYSRIVNSEETLHKPFMIRKPDGLPDPGLGGWIKVCSFAK
jgi:hypothetical protein